MHTLMVSLATNLLTQTLGDTRARHEAYAERVGRVSLVICNRRTGTALSPYRSARVVARPTESRFSSMCLIDGYRMGLEFHHEQPVDLITSQDPFLTALVGMRLRRRLKAPLIIQVNSSIADNEYFRRERPQNGMLQRLARWTLRRADGVRVLTEGERQACIKHGVDPGRISLVPIPTDVTRFRTPAPPERLDEWRRRFTLDRSHPVAVWAGRHDPFKDLPTLLRAFATVHAKLPNARLVLAGVDDAAVGGQIAALGLSGIVHPAGLVPHDDLPALYQIATTYAHSSYYEGLGLVMVEAAAAGLPIVATATDGARQIVIEGETGLIVPIRDPDALARGLIDVLGNPERARALGERGQRRVAELYDQERSISSWIDMWRRVAKQNVG